MNAAQIAAQMATLSAQLVVALRADEDVDYAHVLDSLRHVSACNSTTLDAIADTADNSDGPGWETVTYETNRGRHLLTTVSEGVGVAAKAAKKEQDATAAVIAAVFPEDRPADGSVTVRTSELATF